MLCCRLGLEVSFAPLVKALAECLFELAVPTGLHLRMIRLIPHAEARG